MHRPIGIKNGLIVYASDTLLAQVGEREAKRQLGLLRYYPVSTDLCGGVVMVEADSIEDAAKRYLSSLSRVNQ